MNEEKTLIINIGNICNNNCIICSVNGGYKFKRSFTEIKKDLKQGIKDGFQAVEFTGGEPLIRGDILKLIAEAKNIGYKIIAVSTNGRMFHYKDFCEKAVDAGLSRATFSLYGPSREVHQAVTRTPHSFKETIQGINNIKNFPGLYINISTVVNRLNYKYLDKLSKYILELGIKHWNLLDLIPEGNAKRNYNALAVEYSIFVKELKKIIAKISHFKELNFFDFPPCVFENNFLGKTNVKIQNSKDRITISCQVGYNSNRIYRDYSGKIIDKQKAYIKRCPDCSYYSDCSGFWKQYLKNFNL